MLYSAVRPIARIGLKYYFRRIDLAHLERIPKDAPVILAVNHPTTFLEPCMLACFQENPLYFLARGDFFRSPFFARLLRGVHITPVYRLRDAGYGGIKQNYESFEKSYQILAEQRTLMILAEGRCIHEKRLRPIRKGTARIALGALAEKSLPEVYIVPIGANFTYADRPRSQVMFSCGEPIRASEYLDAYLDSAPAGIKSLTDELCERLKKEVVIIEDIADEPLVEHLLQLYRTEHWSSIAPNGVFHEEAQLLAERRIARTVNTMDQETKQRWNTMAHDYFSRLCHMRIKDEAFAGCYKTEKKRSGFVLWGLLPALLLACWHMPVLSLSQWLAGVKVKTVEFAGPVRWAATLFIYLIYSVLGLVVAAVLGSWGLAVVWLLGIFSIPLLITYGETAWRWLQAWRVRRQPAHLLSYLKQLRQELIAEVSVAWKGDS